MQSRGVQCAGDCGNHGKCAVNPLICDKAVPLEWMSVLQNPGTGIWKFFYCRKYTETV